VEYAERDGQVGSLQVEVERAELVGCAERLVGDRAERKGGDVGAARPLGAAARPVAAPLGLRLGQPGGRGERELLDTRHAGPRLGAQVIRVDGDLTPATRLEALRTAGVLDRRAGRFVAQEDHREAGARLGTQRFGEWQQ